MRALDVHAHLGKDVVFGHVITEENLLDGYKDTIVQGAIVQPSLPRFSLKANKEIHDRIFEFSKCDKMKIWGMASIYPHFTQEEYREEAIRCVKELGFVGLKLTPIGHACDPESEDGMYAFSVAAELGVPMMVHTGSGIPFSSPMHILKAAKEYPELKIVVAHAGMGLMAREAVILAQICENVYLEPTWTGVADMGMIYKELGAEKMMFSSDHVNNVAVQYETIKTVVPEKEMEQVLYKTAERDMNIRKLMKEKVSRVSISSKMSIVMTVSIVLILTVFLGVNRYYNSFFVYQKLENASLTYLDSIDKMMENLVDTLDGYSRICFSNAGVQELLEKNSSGQVDFALQDKVNNYLWELVVNVKQIESIYLYSNNGLVASADKQALHYPRYRCIEDYEWYDEEEYGEYHVDFSSDDFYREGDMPEISFRRAVRSTTNFKKIGYMIMTVSSDVLKDFLVADNADKYESIFCLLNNEESVIVISDDVYTDEMQKIGKDMIQNEKTMVLRNVFDEKYMFCILKSEEGYYMDAISVEDAYQRNRERSLMDIALIILQAMLTLVCIVMISKLYTRPIKELMIAMRCLQNGVFQPVKMNSAHYEIQELIHVYNEMVKKINELLEKTKEAERLKGKADLKVLTAQINPHFLYNTFDSIKALFVLKRYDDAYAMIDALSRFYKINLSKGDDFITIEKNLVMLKSYVDIQQMRFGGEFEYIYSADPEIMQWKILKFALQPLVENAINHGIHGFTTEGIINLDIVRTGEKEIKITLMDNGRGMSKEALKKAISGEEGRNGKSFGLFATLHRLQYCYGDRIWWSIESEENGGTTIIMKIEVEEC